MIVSEQTQVLVRMAARAIGRANLAHAYGHCSTRLDEDHFLVCAARPMGLVRVGEAGTVVPVRGELPEGVLGEVRIHQQIYATRPEIGGVCRTMPPSVMALATLGATPLPRHGFGTYFAPQPPLWDDIQLLRSDEQARQMVAQMGKASAIVMRGNGAVVAAETLEKAVGLTWYLEDAARVELAVRSCGGEGPVISAEDCAKRATDAGRIFERMWEFLTAGDPEAEAQ
ncbi:class II aldolase/adducin family protein [uncultured Brevundimonas sp.]|uniref:class II aldolase/adducin family protein n=1 Tax=uncultured Brevundimonas sp. TaxID=213418 RepID=UPI00261E4325|nr:class II aldolase/adducin family protein [uncultured Brevundimonas sp.]